MPVLNRISHSSHSHRIHIADLPAVNATLNAIAASCCVRLRADPPRPHRAAPRFMLAAFATSALFLVCYVIYHANVGSRAVHRAGADSDRLLHDPDHARRARGRRSCRWRSSR